MIVEYRSSLRDIFGLRRFAQEESFLARLRVYGLPAVAAVAIIIALYIGQGHLSAVSAAIAALCGAVIYWVIPIGSWMHRRNEKQVLTLEADKITTDTRGRHEEIPWKKVVRVTATEDHLFLKVEDHQWLAIPRRVFAESKKWKECLENCERYRRSAARQLSQHEVEYIVWWGARENSDLWEIPLDFEEFDLGTDDKNSAMRDAAISLLEKGLIEVFENRDYVPLTHSKALALLKSESAWDAQLDSGSNIALPRLGMRAKWAEIPRWRKLEMLLIVGIPVY